MSELVLQWHLTNDCEQRCKHCYIYQSSEQAKKTLTLEQIKKGIDNFKKFCDAYKLGCEIHFTGGDPLLFPNLFKVLKYANSLGINLHIMGNPHLLTLDVAKKLKKLGVTSYQMSLDGLKKTHDSWRGKGSFDKTIAKYKVLKRAGIRSACMFTLSNTNKKELILLIKFINGKADVFSFARIVPVNKNMEKDSISAKEYRKLLCSVLKVFTELEKKSKTRFGRKDNLWRLLYKELNLSNFDDLDKDLIYGGCTMGINHMCIDVDGSILVCRRLPIVAGNILKDDLQKVFFEAKEMQKVRDLDKWECKSCELFGVCRGCPAVSFGVYGDYYKKDPGCWKKL